eukprot:1109366-Prorocentrum_minimum.AAC.2
MAPSTCEVYAVSPSTSPLSPAALLPQPQQFPPGKDGEHAGHSWTQHWLAHPELRSFYHSHARRVCSPDVQVESPESLTSRTFPAITKIASKIHL